ncbi:MAG: MotA/TolQ/ExbB proton channel family protein, partial [Planctomycetales bacterium]|nr:MotA/TolQ/ExbB proton channel family protein [Planctomycetales bacterium]
MLSCKIPSIRLKLPLRAVVLCWTLLAGLPSFSGGYSYAQELEDSAVAGGDTTLTPTQLQELANEAARNRASSELELSAPRPTSSLNFLALLIDGGPLMIPIALMSLLVVAISLERFFALRSQSLLPKGLRREIRRCYQDASPGRPENLWSAAEKYPSAAARILQDLLLKIGRPIPEGEEAIREGAQREADYLYGNVRWLTLAAGVTPLIGLLGTVWGMILAFYDSTQLGAGMSKSEHLAEGIYVALVTTLGGLAVAIPAAIFAHYFEGRITRVIAQIELELHRLVPRFESWEGRTRFDLDVKGFAQRPMEFTSAAP